MHHLVEDGSHAFLGKGWVGHSDDGLEVLTCENSALLLNISKLLIFNVNLSI